MASVLFPCFPGLCAVYGLCAVSLQYFTELPLGSAGVEDGQEEDGGGKEEEEKENAEREQEDAEKRCPGDPVYSMVLRAPFVSAFGSLVSLYVQHRC